MKVHEVQQGSVDWMLLRSGIPTASEFDQLVTPEWKVRTGQMPETYVAKKVAEYWQGGPLPSFSSFDMEQGSLLESEAIPWWELEYGQTVRRVGFITTDDGKVGCSPDGLIGGNKGIEAKCPSVHTQVRYLLDGELPKEYRVQVQGSMWVTVFSEWWFLSYRRGFPPLVLSIESDPKAQDAIGAALELYYEKFDASVARMTELNGGPPRRHKFAKPEPDAAKEPDDIFV